MGKVGAPRDIVTTDLVHEVFGLSSVILPDPVTGTPLVIPTAPWHPARPADDSAPVPGPATDEELPGPGHGRRQDTEAKGAGAARTE